ncbi:MAG: hypothetical protein ACTTI6_11270 [Treponema sp.]
MRVQNSLLINTSSIYGRISGEFLRSQHIAAAITAAIRIKFKN